MQLLYYHGSGVAQNLTVDDCNTSVHLLSPVVQVSFETHMRIPMKAKLHSRFGSIFAAFLQRFGTTCSSCLQQVVSFGLLRMYDDKQL